MAKGARGPEKRPRPVGVELQDFCAHPEVIMPTADSAASKVTAALLVIGSKTPVRPHQRQEHRLYRGIPDGARHRISVWVVGDEETAIVHALNSLRRRYTYLFSTGGIGPTYGDITADCVAKHSVCRSIAIRARILSWCRGRRPQLICRARP
jgi:hypothetical protein